MAQFEQYCNLLFVADLELTTGSNILCYAVTQHLK